MARPQAIDWSARLLFAAALGLIVSGLAVACGEEGTTPECRDLKECVTAPGDAQTPG